MFARKVHNLRHFCFSDLICENAALSHAVVVDVKHYPCRVFARLLKKPLQYVHDEFHRCVVVVQQQHPVLAWAFELLSCPRDDGSSLPGSAIVVLSVIAHLPARNI